MNVYGEKITDQQITEALRSLRARDFTFWDLKRQLSKQGVENIDRCGDRVLQRLKAQNQIIFISGKWQWVVS